MHHNLLFEIGTEEIPAGYLAPALNNLNRMMTAKLAELGLSHGEIRTAATPRRLAIAVPNLESRQPDRREEVTGPPRAASFDEDGKPTKAAEGFARSRGVNLEDIQTVQTPKGEYLMVVIEHRGEDTSKLLPGVLAELVAELNFPKSMRWGSGRASFARPVQWLVGIYGDEVIPCEINGIKSGRITRGHRFMAPGPLEVGEYPDYLNSLREAHVLADLEERREAVLKEIRTAAEKNGGRVLEDHDLVLTVTNLVEKPHAVCGSFDEKFLALPREVLITSMREHQKYFAVVDQAGNLLPNFIAVNNNATRDHQLAVNGHQRVLRARLEDAFFFFKEDQNHRLTERGELLSGVVFQTGLGTMLEKTTRLEALAGRLADLVDPSSKAVALRAARLAKADLLTEMVNEFPSLQGVMGRYYAEIDQEPAGVPEAIAEHYLPVRAGSPLPKSAAGAIVSLADRMDTIAGCFGIGKQPTGTTDPYGLRRLCLGLLHIINHRGYSLSLKTLTEEALKLYGEKLSENPGQTTARIIEFIKGRFVNDLTAGGLPITTVEAATEVEFDDILDCRRRIEALAEFQGEEMFTILAGSFKRVKNITKGHQSTRVDESLLIEPAEIALHQALEQVRRQVSPLLERRDYQGIMAEIISMKEPVDQFFDQVMVMADDDKLKDNRLALLTAISQLFLKLGDFSRMG